MHTQELLNYFHLRWQRTLLNKGRLPQVQRKRVLCAVL